MNLEKELPKLKLLSNAIHSMLDAVIIFDMSWVCIFVNEQFTGLFEIKEEKLLGNRFMEFSGIENQKVEEIKKIMVLTEKTKIKEKIGPIDLTIITRNGKKIPVNITGRLIKDNTGNPTHIIVVIRNITIHKQMEKEMKKHQDDLEKLVKERTAKLIKGNEKLKKEIVHRKQMENALRDVIRFGPLERNDETIGFLAISRDITDRKKTQRKLQESEAKYRTLVEQSIQGLVVIQDFRIVYANPAFSQISRYSIEELLSFSSEEFKTLLHPDDRKKTWDCLRKRLEKEDVPPKAQFRIIRKNGEVQWVQIVSSYINYEGSPATQIAVLDITDLKQAKIKLKTYSKELEKRVLERTKELQSAQDELVRKERLAMLGQLAGSVGHELRNPLGVISNSAYYLRMKSKNDDEKIQKHLNIIDRNIERADKIISDLLDFSRIKEPIQTKSGINSIVEDVLKTIKKPKNIIIKTELDESIPPIRVDPDQIQQAFLNIMLNAFQAMPEGGELYIKTSATEYGISILFKDTGEGISQENLKEITKPLFTTRKKGIGLGLAIVKSIIDGHNGIINIESILKEGTAITITLPFEE